MHTLRNTFTQKLRKNYASITQIVYAKYAHIVQIRLRSNYAIISVLRNYIMQKLRRNLITQKNYAIITQFNYANTITQFLKKSLRRLRKYRIQLRRNSGHYAMGNLLMLLDRHCDCQWHRRHGGTGTRGRRRGRRAWCQYRRVTVPRTRTRLGRTRLQVGPAPAAHWLAEARRPASPARAESPARRLASHVVPARRLASHGPGPGRGRSLARY